MDKKDTAQLEAWLHEEGNNSEMFEDDEGRTMTKTFFSNSQDHQCELENEEEVLNEMPPMTAAEKQKKYRDKLKRENPEKYEEIQNKAKERSASYYE
ncbi:unnamed protein product [Parnassius mnemosyne]|uniref:Uncharacterized protein n=1 Tax=Parnassius mnemosyne TaxID=213953 RepID=A0AAV1KW93_9NEOP